MATPAPAKKKKAEKVPTEIEIRAAENRKKMEALFETFVKFQIKEPSTEDDDFVTYKRVEVYQRFTKEGPEPGKKFLRVDLNPTSGDVIFRLKNGGSRVVVLSLKPGAKPQFGGDFPPPEAVQDEQDSDGETYIPKGRQPRV